jgi:hypothetical protein
MRLLTKTIRFDRAGLAAPGYEVSRFTFPDIDRHFKSELLNDRNYALSGGAPWRAVLGQVVDRRKPVGFVDSEDANEMRDAARLALDGGCAVRFAVVTLPCEGDSEPTRRVAFCSAAIEGRVGEVFDIETLLTDYRSFLEVVEDEDRREQAWASITDKLHALADAEVPDFLEFTAVEGTWWEGTPTPADWARRGLLFGYPVETTAALMLEDLGVAGCGSDYGDDTAEDEGHDGLADSPPAPPDGNDHTAA